MLSTLGESALVQVTASELFSQTRVPAMLQPLRFALLRLLGLCAILLTALHRSRSIHCWQDLRPARV